MIREKPLRTFDLNLLKVFIAIWDARSLSLAGDQLALTQPAVSHALKRLREQFGDPLFVRVGNEMIPTETATRLYEPALSSLQIMEQALLGQREFRPERASRTFRLAMSDVSEYYFLPDMLKTIGEHAPNIRIQTVNLDLSNIDFVLKSGAIDLAIGYVPFSGTDQLTIPLLTDHHVCIVRKEHPFPRNQLRLEEFASLSFVDVSKSVPGYAIMEQHLSQLGIERNVTARLGHLSVLPEIVRQTNLAALYPASVIARLPAAEDFRILQMQFALAEVPIGIHAHKRFATDPAVSWLCHTIRRVFKNDSHKGAEKKDEYSNSDCSSMKIAHLCND